MEKDPSIQSTEHMVSIPVAAEAPSKVESKKELTDTEYLENSRQMGELYVALIQSLIGQAELAESRFETVDAAVASRLRKMKASVDAHRERQRLTVELKGMTREDILRPALSRLSREQAEELLQVANYRVEETAPGMFVVYMDALSMRKITSGQAVAVMNPNTVSFIMIRELPDKPEYMKNYLRENLPHEIHHIAWAFQKWDEIVKYAEEDEEMRLAFAMYQDEILAKMSSEGALLGYSHLNVCSDSYKTELAAKRPEVIDVIKQRVGKLNLLLSDEIEPLIAETDIKHQDLIYAVMESASFDELETNLLRIKSIIDSQPRKANQPGPAPVSSDGWGSI